MILLIPLRCRAGKENGFANLRECPVERTQTRSTERTPPQESTKWDDATNGLEAAEKRWIYKRGSLGSGDNDDDDG